MKSNKSGNLAKIACACLIGVLASKPAIDYGMGVNSPFAKFNKLILSLSESEYQNRLGQSRERITEQGKPNFARVLGLPYSLRHSEYWSNTLD